MVFALTERTTVVLICAGRRAMATLHSFSTVVLLLHLTAVPQGYAMYHSSSEILHWFSHTARKYPDRMR